MWNKLCRDGLKCIHEDEGIPTGYKYANTWHKSHTCMILTLKPPPQTHADFWLPYIVGGFICLHSLELGGFMARYFGEQYHVG